MLSNPFQEAMDVLEKEMKELDRKQILYLKKMMRFSHIMIYVFWGLAGLMFSSWITKRGWIYLPLTCFYFVMMYIEFLHYREREEKYEQEILNAI